MAVLRPMTATDVETLRLRLGEVDLGGRRFDVEPDDAARVRIAKALGVVALPRLEAVLTVEPWLDGAEIRGVWSAAVIQTCGVSLDEFEAPLSGTFVVRVVPPGSANAPSVSPEMELDPDAADPPDVLDDDVVDVGGYLLEHVALEVDPFPRKPGAVFEPPETAEIISPFASLRTLKP